MRKIWLVAKGEYLKRVAKRSFLLGTLLIPLMFTIIIAATIFIIERDKNTDPFGYIDHIGILAENKVPELEKGQEMIKFISYPDRAAAQTALESGEIQAFHVIPENFLESRMVDLYYLDDYPDTSVLIQFDDFVRANVLPEGPNIIQNRIIEGVNLTLRSADGKRQFDEDVGFT